MYCIKNNSSQLPIRTNPSQIYISLLKKVFLLIFLYLCHSSSALSIFIWLYYLTLLYLINFKLICRTQGFVWTDPNSLLLSGLLNLYKTVCKAKSIVSDIFPLFLGLIFSVTHCLSREITEETVCSEENPKLHKFPWTPSVLSWWFHTTLPTHLKFQGC